jgi:putative endonuclease
MSNQKADSYYFGIIGEYFAIAWYVLKLYTPIKYRFKTKVGEIDFICKKFNTLVFVEVKSRSSNYDDLLCSKKQQQRILRTAELFLVKNPLYMNYKLRFDLVLINPYSWPKIITNFIEL